MAFDVTLAPEHEVESRPRVRSFMQDMVQSRAGGMVL
jgi:hypothetical protein